MTPWDVVFGGGWPDEEHWDLIRQQDEARGSAAPAELLQLPAAGDLLRDLLPSDYDAQLHSAFVEQVGALLFHGYRSWLHDRRVWSVSDETLRALMDIGGEGAEPPAPAGYVQWPHQRVWGRVAEDAVPEPVDGFFFSREDGRLELLFALGVRAGRPGFSVLRVAAPPELDVRAFAQRPARASGDDFANILPGGELQEYRALTTPGEALRLALLCFGRLASEGDG